MSRIAYFKGINQTALDETQNALIGTIQGQYASLSTEVGTKASASALSALSSDVATKATASALNALSVVVDAKAEASALTALSGVVDTKASASALTVVSNAVNTKLPQSTYDARLASEAVFYESVQASIALVDESGVELDYVALGLVSAPVVAP